MNSLVSIIVPCYNQAHFLKDSLQSVLDQSYAHWECVIVNDGSPDDTAIIAKQWCERDERFQYVEKSNGGLSSARNSGIGVAKGKFILPLDADDILHSDYLIKTVYELKNNPKLTIVSCYSIFFKGAISNCIRKQKPVGTTYHALLYENIMMATSMYRKSDWVRVGGYDETMKKGFEDWEFWISMTKNGSEFKFIEEFLFYYRKSENSMLIDTLNNHMMENMEYVYKKHKEIYINQFDKTIDYLFYVINKHHSSERKIKSSIEYNIAKLICKPFRLLQNRKNNKG